MSADSPDLSGHFSESPASKPVSSRDSAPSSDRDLRNTILDAAAGLFAERGYNATSVRSVVEAAGCTKPSLYYYFKSKEELFLELVGDSTRHITVLLEDTIDGPGKVEERLARSLGAVLDFVTDNPTVLRLLMTAERHPEHGQPKFDFDSLRARHIEICRGALEDGMRDGTLRHDMDVEEATLALFGMVDHRLVLYLHGRPIPDDYPAKVIDLFLNGARARE